MVGNYSKSGLNALAGVLFGLAATVNAFTYFARPNLPQMELLRDASTYIEQNRENPKKALDYAQRRVGIVMQENPGNRELSDLANELLVISDVEKKNFSLGQSD